MAVLFRNRTRNLDPEEISGSSSLSQNAHVNFQFTLLYGLVDVRIVVTKPDGWMFQEACEKGGMFSTWFLPQGSLLVTMSVSSEIQGKPATKEIPGGKGYLSVEPITTLYPLP